MPKIQMRRDTAANWKSVNPILLAGEWALETDTRLMKIGDGTTAYNALPYSTAEDSDEWQKPADWIDIRSGAIPNSVYFLVGHSADYATYPTFTVLAGVSNSGNYDVFVDGVKQATTSSGTETTLNWQTLALESGWDVTYPAALKTHVVRVTPTSDSDTLTSIRTDYNVVKGVMWAHITLTEIGLYRFLSAEGNVTTDRAPLFEALTTPTNEIKVTFFTGAFNCIKNIKTLPVFVGKGNAYANRVGTNATFLRSGIKRVHFKDFWLGDPYACFRKCNNLEFIELENSHLSTDSYIFEDCYKLKRLPNPLTINSLSINAITNATALEPTVLDLSQKTTYTRVDVRGSSTYPMKGLKGITVSNEAPFTGTSPQINVSYTGLDRQALVNLFKSMPTVSAGQVCNITGATGAADLTTEDLAIATDKGWTITR